MKAPVKTPGKAIELFRTKDMYGDGFIEIVIWKVPAPVAPSEHSFKYRLAYVVKGRRIVGYDNERGKGDHRHIARKSGGGRETPYRFVSPERLIDDFMADVKGAGK